MNAEADLRSAVAAILDASAMPEEQGLPRELRELTAIRSATHRILEDDDVEPEPKAGVMRDLLTTARSATLRDWAIQTMESEIDLHLDREPRPRLGDRIQSARALQRLGFSRCPTCRLDILSEYDIAFLERLDAEWHAAEARHAQAVTP